MRRIWIVLTALTVLVLSAAYAPFEVFASADAVSVSFAHKNEKVYSGIPFEAEIELSAPAGKDITVVVSGSGGSSECRIAAGATTALVKLQSPAEEGGSLTYTLESGDGYQIGKVSKLTVEAYDAPAFSLGNSDIKYIKVGGSYENKIISSDRNYVVRDTKFSLRLGSEQGQVVGEVVMSQWGSKAEFEIQHNPEWERINEVYVCFDAAGTVCGKMVIIMGKEDDYGIRKVQTDQKTIAISFDCAYGTEFTDYILDLLDEYNARATFFVTGEWVENNPEYVVKIHERGHDIGNHSLTHPKLTTLTDQQIYDELDTVSDRVEALTGVRPTVFRPPYGNYSSRVVGVAEYVGCSTILWTYDSLDWREDISPEKIIDISTRESAQGDLVLFHNGALLTKETLHVILDYYTKDLGLQIISISDQVYKGDRSVSDKGLVTPGSDYSYYSAKSLLETYQLPEDVRNRYAGYGLELQFDDTQWFLYKEDVQAIAAGSSDVKASVDISADLAASATPGQEVGKVTFSYFGQPDITASIVISQSTSGVQGDNPPSQDSTRTDVSDDDNNAAGSNNDELPEQDNNSQKNTLTANIVLIAAVAIVIFVLKIRRNSRT